MATQGDIVLQPDGLLLAGDVVRVEGRVKADGRVEAAELRATDRLRVGERTALRSEVTSVGGDTVRTLVLNGNASYSGGVAVDSDRLVDRSLYASRVVSYGGPLLRGIQYALHRQAVATRDGSGIAAPVTLFRLSLNASANGLYVASAHDSSPFGHPVELEGRFSLLPQGGGTPSLVFERGEDARAMVIVPATWCSAPVP